MQDGVIRRIAPFGALVDIGGVTGVVSKAETEDLIRAGLISEGDSVAALIIHPVGTTGQGPILTISGREPLELDSIVECRITHVDVRASSRHDRPLKCIAYAATDDNILITCDVVDWVDPQKRLRPGQRVSVRVVPRDCQEHWLPYGEIIGPPDIMEPHQNIPEIGTELEGVVKTVKDYGAFVVVADGVAILLHRTSIVQDSVANLGEYLHPGDIVKVIIRESTDGNHPYTLDFVARVGNLLDDSDLPEGDIFDLKATRRRGTSGGFVRTSTFKAEVLDAFAHVCVICGICQKVGEDITAAEAAHIVPRGKRGSDMVGNGLCLCQLHHWAFDRGLLAVEEDNRIVVSPYVQEREGVAGGLAKLAGQSLRWPEGREIPQKALAWHKRNVFLRPHFEDDGDNSDTRADHLQ